MASATSSVQVTILPPDTERHVEIEASARVDLAQRLGVYAVSAFLFIRFSRVTDDWSEVLPGFSLTNLRIPLIASILALVITVGTGGLRRALVSRAGFFLSAFSVWLVVAVPFSFWRRGSGMMIRDDWSKAFLVFIIVAGLLRTVKQCRQAMYAIGCGSLLIALMFLRNRNALSGRLASPVSHPTFIRIFMFR